MSTERCTEGDLGSAGLGASSAQLHTNNDLRSFATLPLCCQCMASGTEDSPCEKVRQLRNSRRRWQVGDGDLALCQIHCGTGASECCRSKPFGRSSDALSCSSVGDAWLGYASLWPISRYAGHLCSSWGCSARLCAGTTRSLLASTTPLLPRSLCISFFAGPGVLGCCDFRRCSCCCCCCRSGGRRSHIPICRCNSMDRWRCACAGAAAIIARGCLLRCYWQCSC
mmetsp:Transcript_132012/g.263434  ORF Transcript_132012/g.263434 Transcript_132012/m.263434 type:complete len:225 (-) Transcript_132012:965-1639(-)